MAAAIKVAIGANLPIEPDGAYWRFWVECTRPPTTAASTGMHREADLRYGISGEDRTTPYEQGSDDPIIITVR